MHEPSSETPTPRGRTPADECVDAFALLEYLLEAAGIRCDPTARPFLFELAPDGDMWIFDPHSPRTLFHRVEGVVPSGSISKMTCSPPVLVRLLTSANFALEDDEHHAIDGSVDDLLPLARALEGVTTMLGLRGRRSHERRVRR